MFEEERDKCEGCKYLHKYGCTCTLPDMKLRNNGINTVIKLKNTVVTYLWDIFDCPRWKKNT